MLLLTLEIDSGSKSRSLNGTVQRLGTHLFDFESPKKLFNLHNI